jgi:hypothetical protein
LSESSAVVNEALYLIGFDGPAVTGAAPNFDSSTAGQAAATLYATAVEAVARMHAWDFARTSSILSLTGNLAPFPWAYEYNFPANCVQVWQLAPASLCDANNPYPINWLRGAAVVNSVMSSVIWSDTPNAQAIFNGNPIESAWDPLFRADVVRYLASEFSIALLGKPDLAQGLMGQVGEMTQVGASRSDT